MKILELLGASRLDGGFEPRASGAFTAHGYAEGESASTDRRHRSLAELGAKNAGWNTVEPPKTARKPKRQPPRKLKAVRSVKPMRGVLVEPPKPPRP